MRLVKLITPKQVFFLFLAVVLQQVTNAQENSPYSRYGIGDLVPNQNIQTRAMGGVSAAIADYQTLNASNPASYANVSTTLFDLGAEADIRKLKSPDNTKNYTATNSLFSYMQLGFPIKMKNANKKNIFWGMSFGLKPISRINYKIISFQRHVDSMSTIYEGSGGTNLAFIGTAVRIRNFSAGFNVGYMFGNKNYSTQITFLNDTVYYQESNSAARSNFGGLYYNAGLLYKIDINKKNQVRIGAYGSLKQALSATNNVIRETVSYDSYNGYSRVDSVYEKSTSGNVTYPSTLGVGVTYQNEHWLLGTDYEQTNWVDYRFFGIKEKLQSNWKIRLGAEYFPADERTLVKKYFRFVRYRFGFFYGPDYIKLDKSLPEYGVTFGAGFPLKLRKTSYYETQTSILNTAIEIGSRGNNQSAIKENIIRICVGLSLGDLWFRRAKYD